MKHGLKDIAFYVQKHITHYIVVVTSPLVRDKPLGVPASVKHVYYKDPHDIEKTGCIYYGDTFADMSAPLYWDSHQ